MRTYMKPVMESEAFVANEFVAACWTIDCQHEKCTAIQKGYNDMYTNFNNKNYESFTDEDGTRFYYLTGDLNNLPGCQTYSSSSKPGWATGWLNAVYWFMKYILRWNPDIEENTKYHLVTLNSGHPNHPNASV